MNSTQPVATQALASSAPTSSAFLPAFQLLCEEKFQTMEGVIDALEILQRRTLLLNPTLSPEELPGPTRNAPWRWRTKVFFQINENQELEYMDKERKKPWRRVVGAADIFQIVSDVHCKAVMHAGQDKTEDYISKRYKGIPRDAMRFTLAGCQACAKR
jgi:hypothetical protein